MATSKKATKATKRFAKKHETARKAVNKRQRPPIGKK